MSSDSSDHIFALSFGQALEEHIRAHSRDRLRNMLQLRVNQKLAGGGLLEQPVALANRKDQQNNHCTARDPELTSPQQKWGQASCCAFECTPCSHPHTGASESSYE